MKKWLILFIPILTASLCYIISKSEIEAPRNAYWNSLGSPPEKAIEIVDTVWSTVYVKTALGNIYSINTGAQESGWFLSEFPAYPSAEANGSCERLVLPSNTVDYAQVCSSGSDIHYVILDDGSVQYASDFVGDMDWGAYLDVMTVFATTVFGFLIGVVITVILAWRQRAKS